MEIDNTTPKMNFVGYTILVACIVILIIALRHDRTMKDRGCPDEDFFNCAAEMKKTMNYLCTKGKHIRNWSDLDKARYAWGRVMFKDKSCAYCRGRCEIAFPEMFRCGEVVTN